MVIPVFKPYSLMAQYTGVLERNKKPVALKKKKLLQAQLISQLKK